MTAKIIVVINVVIKNFFAILGFFGAPGSFPSSFSLKVSLFDWIPIGKTVVEDNLVKVKLFSDSNQLSFVNVILINSEERF